MPIPTSAFGDSNVRNLIEADAIEEPVRRFLTALNISSEPSVVEMNGRRVFILVKSATDNAEADGTWTVEKNQRRHTLVDRQIDGTITIEETVELAELTAALDRWIDAVAPLPLEHARQIHDALVAKTLTSSRTGSTEE